MKREKAFEIRKLIEEICQLEYLIDSDYCRDLEYLAKRIQNAATFNYPKTAFKLRWISKVAQRYIHKKIRQLIKELEKELENEH